MTNLIGIGLDLVDLKDFGAIYGDFDPDVLARCFSENEILEVGTDSDRLERLAGRFAIKEATYKSLGGGIEIAYSDIETRRTVEGVPSVTLVRSALKMLKPGMSVFFKVSMSHSGATAGAVGGGRVPTGPRVSIRRGRIRASGGRGGAGLRLFGVPVGVFRTHARTGRVRLEPFTSGNDIVQRHARRPADHGDRSGMRLPH